MDEKTKLFLRNLYKKHYFKHAQKIVFPLHIDEREIGYMDFEGKMVRHLSFKNEGELIADILKQGPASIFCSNARYENPTLPMDEKVWKGAELIFDIDADQIETNCRNSHDFWFCMSCSGYGRSPFPQTCPLCGKGIIKIKGRCNTCIGNALKHANQVISILKDDFGVNRSEIKLYFSGNRGFHIHVFDNRFFSLNQDARLEIALYIAGESLPPPKALAINVITKSDTEISGWLKRISNHIKTEKGRTNTVRLITNYIHNSLPKIDHQVTSDIHRIFRLAGTLHNRTGFLKTEVTGDDFDPNYDPVVIDEEAVKIRVKYYPSFNIKGEHFGPFREEEIKIPAYAAVQILTSGLGEVC